MKTTYTNSEKKIEVTDGIVTASDCQEFCPVGKKPNMDFIRKTGWKKTKVLGLYEKSARKFA